MEKTIKKGTRTGEVILPSSKSAAHRALICAALTKGENRVVVKGISNDIRATAFCLNALFNNVEEEKEGFILKSPQITPEKEAVLYCKESGTTLRLLLPLVGVFGINATFVLEGRLPDRPINELVFVLTSHGMTIEKKGNKIITSGKLISKDYEIRGDVSSQYISALLFALPLIEGENRLVIKGDITSKGYISMTEKALSLSNIDYKKKENIYIINGKREYFFEKEHYVEADWSAATAFLAMGAVSQSGITLKGLDLSSAQGDKEVVNILEKIGANIEKTDNAITIKKGKLKPINIYAEDIPDAVPVLASLLSAINGKSEIAGCGRLRFKESDRIKSTTAMLSALGADIEAGDTSLLINGNGKLGGGEAPVFSDHRIAFAAAVAAGFSNSDIKIDNEKCVEKSYPDFWRDFENLKVEK